MVLARSLSQQPTQQSSVKELAPLHTRYTSASVTCAPYVALFQVTPRPSQRRSGSDRPIKHLAVFLAAGRFNIETTAVKAVASADDCICCCLRGVSVSVILFPLSLRFVPCFARNAAVVHRPSPEPHALIFSKPRNKAKEYTMQTTDTTKHHSPRV